MMVWQETLKNLAENYKQKQLMSFFQADPARAEKYGLEVGEIYLDYSKNFLDDKTLSTLINIAQQNGLAKSIERLLTGEKINKTENRPALHTALRQNPQMALSVEGKNVIPSIVASREKMATLVQQLHSGLKRGATGKPISHVVNLGIGGSDLGPKMVVQALAPYQQEKLKISFVSNVDPTEILACLEQSNPEETLFVISSKSFTTPETLLNAATAKQWLQEAMKVEEVSMHFVAVTARPEKAKAWGVLEENTLCFEEWVGGRYSVWSTIGLSVALSIGMSHFEDFLAGARLMDEHFSNAPFEANMPILLALIGLWYIHGFDARTQAVLPYAHGLRCFPDYLQQLDMESNGKSVQLDGQAVKTSTGPIIWGQAGTNGQHAFYQLLHQGTHFVPIDFIVCAKTHTKLASQHDQFVANALAQAQAFMQGEKGAAAHEYMPGNKPSNVLLLKKLTPFALGELLALYEHKVFVQGALWGINSFDQPGVELGKKLANKVNHALVSGEKDHDMDPSTERLIQKIRSF